MHVQPEIVPGPGIVDHLSYLIPLYDKVSSINGIPHVNIASRVLANIDSDDVSAFFLDEVHLTERGASLVASIAFESLSALKPQDYLNFSNAKTVLPESGISVELMRLISGTANEFSNSLLSFRYDVINRGEEIVIGDLEPGSLVGLFYLNDPSSGWIKLTTDCGECFDLCLFDHYSFMPRLHYLTLPDASFIASITLKVIEKPIDYDISINAYRESATFDPSADWAVKKWYEPLIAAMNNPQNTSLKPVLLLAKKS